MANRYVGFVSDSHFLKCIAHVCTAYKETKTELTVNDLRGNGLDPFKTVFDIANRKLDFDKWMAVEAVRQADKTLNNRIGEFHQMLLGGVRGWVDLGIGDDSKLDLMKSDKSAFMELKNKYNTVNADSADKVRDKLEAAITTYPKATAYWAYIISKKNDSGEKVWKKKGRRTDERIKAIWGAKVYELITGDANALRNTWKALPVAIADYFKGKAGISEPDMKKLVELFESALG